MIRITTMRRRNKTKTNSWIKIKNKRIGGIRIKMIAIFRIREIKTKSTAQKKLRRNKEWIFKSWTY